MYTWPVSAHRSTWSDLSDANTWDARPADTNTCQNIIMIDANLMQKEIPEFFTFSTSQTCRSDRKECTRCPCTCICWHRSIYGMDPRRQNSQLIPKYSIIRPSEVDGGPWVFLTTSDYAATFQSWLSSSNSRLTLPWFLHTEDTGNTWILSWEILLPRRFH